MSSTRSPLSSMSWFLSWVTLVLAVVANTAGAASTKTQRLALPYSQCFSASSAKHSVPVVLLQAMVATESNWNPSARSHANAHGLMQIQWPGTAKHLGVRRVAQLYKPCTNIDLGARYMRELLGRYEGDERRALAAYNYGPGRIANTGPIPSGADRYVATVRRHRAEILGAANSARSVAPSGKERVATFSSAMRAKRFAKLLQRRVPRGTFVVSSVRPGRYELWLTEGAELLSADDRVLLTSLGWRL